LRATLTFILLTALRDRLFPALGGLLLAAAALALFAGQATLVEEREAAVVLGAGAARVIVVFGLLIFVTFHVQRLIDSRELEVLLARPLSRERLVLALAAGYGAVASLLVVGVAGPIILAAPDRNGGLAFAGSLLLESWIVCALALFAALTLERAVVATLVGAGFYVFGRLASMFVAIAESGRDALIGPKVHSLLDWVIIGISMVMPRLDLFGQTRWLVHGVEDGAVVRLMVVQAALYPPLLLAAAMFDLRRKRV
jgi:hypothetical protein